MDGGVPLFGESNSTRSGSGMHSAGVGAIEHSEFNTLGGLPLILSSDNVTHSAGIPVAYYIMRLLQFFQQENARGVLKNLVASSNEDEGNVQIGQDVYFLSLFSHSLFAFLPPPSHMLHYFTTQLPLSFHPPASLPDRIAFRLQDLRYSLPGVSHRALRTRRGHFIHWFRCAPKHTPIAVWCWCINPHRFFTKKEGGLNGPVTRTLASPHSIREYPSRSVTTSLPPTDYVCIKTGLFWVRIVVPCWDVSFVGKHKMWMLVT